MRFGWVPTSFLSSGQRDRAVQLRLRYVARRDEIMAAGLAELSDVSMSKKVWVLLRMVQVRTSRQWEWWGTGPGRVPSAGGGGCLSSRAVRSRRRRFHHRCLGCRLLFAQTRRLETVAGCLPPVLSFLAAIHRSAVLSRGVGM
jgi:hypothetical protein